MKGNQKMKQVELKRIMPDSPDTTAFRKINDLSFPSNEHLEIEEMFEFNNMDMRVMGIYVENLFKGFFTLIVEEKCVYIAYFAIDPVLRGSGVGTESIRQLLEMYSDRQIVVDFEAYDEEGAPNPKERKRRRDFYLRRGFHSTGFFMYYMESVFEVACSNENMDITSYQKMLDEIHAGAPEFPGKMYQREWLC